MLKTIALYGGSFNPSTKAHLDIGLLLRDQLPVEEVWYLISPQNPFKSKEGMASFAQRAAMARLNVEGHPRLAVQEIEATYARNCPDGIIDSATTLRCLTRDFPQHRFIWTMGADNFANFHEWGDARYIAENFPMAIIPRSGHTDMALHSPSAERIPHITSAEELKTSNGWFLLQGMENGINATLCRTELAQGAIPATMRPAVAAYALNNQIYAPH